MGLAISFDRVTRVCFGDYSVSSGTSRSLGQTLITGSNEATKADVQGPHSCLLDCPELRNENLTIECISESHPPAVALNSQLTKIRHISGTESGILDAFIVGVSKIPALLQMTS
jgi:hypothetical protein